MNDINGLNYSEEQLVKILPVIQQALDRHKTALSSLATGHLMGDH
jgi:hypothetical protein